MPVRFNFVNFFFKTFTHKTQSNLRLECYIEGSLAIRANVLCRSIG